MSNSRFRTAWLGAVRNERLATTIARFVDHVQTVRLGTLTDTSRERSSRTGSKSCTMPSCAATPSWRGSAWRPSWLPPNRPSSAWRKPNSNASTKISSPVRPGNPSDVVKPHPLQGPEPFKLGVFSTNADGGLAITTCRSAGRRAGTTISSAAQIADRAGWNSSCRSPAGRASAARQGARMVVRDVHLGGRPRRRDRADRHLHDRARAARASALCGQGAGDGRPHQQRPRRPQHRLRLEPEGIRACSARARRGGLRPGGRMDRDHRARLCSRRAVRLSTATTTS